MKKLVDLKRFPVIFALFLISLNNVLFACLDDDGQKHHAIDGNLLHGVNLHTAATGCR
ncbi:MAG: hypothetical protein LBJ04_16985 [Sphingobacterium sp.]|jgi:hypothetical protein|uniref:hypothetical protein n=1 Tax=Sphingobacterium sp. TaxID=341027 RepID=UPI00282DE773|nr:hypothetical protein [Sphingobacterium sp.]MDR0264915.1 hypothetical protein [Sphingobacterium sp.]